MCSNTWTIPGAVLDSLRGTLKPDGVLVVLVPQGPRLFGTLDREPGTQAPLHAPGKPGRLLESHGFDGGDDSTVSTRPARRPGGLTAGCSARANINKPVLKIFDKTVWIWRRLDRADAVAGAVADRRGAEARERGACRGCPPASAKRTGSRPLPMPTESARRPLRALIGRVRRQADPGDRRPDARRVHLGQGVADLARSAGSGGERHRGIVLSGRRRQRGAQCARVHRAVSP